MLEPKAKAENVLSTQTSNLSIEDCIELAITNNPSMAEKELEVHIQEANVGVAFSEFFPELKVESYYETWDDEHPYLPFNYTGDVDIQDVSPYYTSKESLVLSQPIYHGGENFYRLKKAEADLSSTVYDMKVRRLDLIYRVKRTYLDVLKSKKLLDIQMDNLYALRRNLEIAEFEFEEGAINKIDLLDARKLLYEAMVETIKALDVYEYNIVKLNIIIGRKTNAPVILEDIKEIDMSKYSLPSKEEASIMACLNRPEIFRVDSKIKSSQMNLKGIEAGYWPRLDLEGKYNFSQDEIKGDYEDWSVKFKVTLPVSESIKNVSKVKKAKAEMLQTEIEKEKLKEVIDLEIQQSISNLEESSIKLQTAQEKLKEAKEKFEILSFKKDQGLMSKRSFILSELDFNKIREDYVKALHRYCLDRITFDRVISSVKTSVIF